MAQPVTVENEAVRLQVWPQFGGKVSSLVDKADGYELLFNFPAELPAGPQYDVPYVSGWYGGWDECFPAVAPSVYERHPYQGIPVPDHGELWGVPTTAVPAKGGITVVWHGLRFGYRLTRKLTLDGPTITAEYTLVNLAPFEFRFVWSAHPLLSMTAPLRLDPGAAAAGEAVAGFRLSHDSDGKEIHTSFAWPTPADGIDLSDPAALPPRKAWKSYSNEPIAGPATVRYPTRGRSLRMEYASDDGLHAYWGIWVNTGGWAGQRHVALEPTTGRYNHIDRSVRDGSAGRVGPAGKIEWTLRMTLG